MNEKRYYLDTSIWLDFIESRIESIIPKLELIFKIGTKDIYTREYTN